MERAPHARGRDRPLILFAGDVHGQFGHLDAAVRDLRPQAIVLLGDIQAPLPLAEIAAPWEAHGTESWFIPGNHDSGSEAHWRHLESLKGRNLHGRVMSVAGVRIAGLGGVFRGEVGDPRQAARYASYRAYAAALRGRDHRRASEPGPLRDAAVGGRLLKHLSTIFPEEYEALLGQQADILVTHEAPSCHPYGFPAIDALAKALSVNSLFHGHHHDCRDYRAWDQALGFRAYGVGLRGLLDQDGVLRRAGEKDRERGR